MASPSDRDRDSNESQSKPENPFIKFRQFADAQIGSLLQGIIGLPSAFSRNPSTRWADFDDDLRRRDELKVRQKQLKDAEARRVGQQSQKDDVEIPVGKSPDWDNSSRPYKNPYRTVEMDDAVTIDVNLYSPVTKDLFAKLRQIGDNHLEWKEVQEPTTSWSSEAFWRLMQPEKSSSNPMRALQNTAYEDLNRSPLFRSEYSLLPYILFSSYSPLRLSSSIQSPEALSYCDAFEDLILVSQGRRMKSPLSRLINRDSLYALGLKSLDLTRNVTTSHMDWIQKLRATNILQQKEIQEGRQALLSKSWHVSSRPAWPVNTWLEMLEAEDEENDRDAETEQEMYDRFLNWASSPIALEKVMDSLFKDTSTFFEQQIKAREHPDGKHHSMDDPKESFLTDGEGYIERKLKELAAMAPESYPGEKRSSEEATQDAEKSKESKNGSVFDPDEVVSTRTETERTVNPDGTIETSITIWKRFADGRISTTSTTHIEEPAQDEDIPHDSYVLHQDLKNLEQEQKEKLKREEEQKKTTEKKGWFWN